MLSKVEARKSARAIEEDDATSYHTSDRIFRISMNSSAVAAAVAVSSSKNSSIAFAGTTTRVFRRELEESQR
jgi:hypothetical protein